MIPRPTLLVHTTYFPLARSGEDDSQDPERAGATRLGAALYGLLTRPAEEPLTWGAGVPVRVATRFDLVNPEEAEHVVVIPVLGRRSHAREDVRQEVLARVRDWAGQRSVHVVPVLASAAWRTEEGRLAVKPLLTELAKGEDAPRATTLEEIVLALARVLNGKDSHDSRLFVSHAKADLTHTDRAAELIANHVETSTTGRAFFDKVSLLAGEDLDAQVSEGASRGVFVAVRGDAYSSRSWCQLELLKAKRARLPTLTVEVLSRGERRSLAYGGNSPTVVWDRSAGAKAAQHVALSAMVESVRHALFVAEARRVAECAGLDEKTVVAMSRPPELLDLPALRLGPRGRVSGTVVVLHPDPELSVAESGVLSESDPNLRLLTPTTALAGGLNGGLRTPLDGLQVAMSLSESPDAGGPQGYTEEHLRDATVLLARALIASGAAIAYGGDFRQNGYTEVLSQLVLGWNQTARRPADLLHCYLAAHVDPARGENLVFTEHFLGPDGIAHAEASLAPPGRPLPAHRSALHFSDMRRVMERHIDARVALGGKVSPKGPSPGGYGGRYPGIVEEAWRSLERGTPLYVAGGFGGAAALVAELLQGDGDMPLLREQRWEQDATWKALTQALDRDPDVDTLGLPRTQEGMAQAIRAGRRHLDSDEAARAWNGLTVAENRALFRTRDALTMTALVLKGLFNVRAKKSAGKLHIELVRGDVTDARQIGVFAFPVFSDLELRGAGDALDRATGGAATESKKSSGPTANRGDGVGAEFLYAADLGTVAQGLAEPAESVRRAADSTAQMVLRHGFARLGIVTFLGNTSERVADVVEPMVRGLQPLAGRTVVWFERDRARFETLRTRLAQERQVVLTTREIPQRAPPAVSAVPGRTYLPVRQTGRDELEVALLVPRGNALSPIHRRTLDEAERNALVGAQNALAPEGKAMEKAGKRMVKLLFGDSPETALGALRETELVIVHDATTAGLPYETLCWKDPEGKAWVRPAAEAGLIRRLLADGIAIERGLVRPPRAELGVLLVVNPRGDLKGADREGAAVAKTLERIGITPTILRHEDATVHRVREAIADPKLDVLHYCGHGFFRGAGLDASGLTCADGDLNLRHMQEMPRASLPRLAFVNACQGGRVRGSPHLKGSEAHAFAEFFLRSGVDAYLGTFWLVTDPGADTFARSVYETLAKGEQLGTAVVLGRKALLKKNNPDWANYLLYGHAGFRLVQPR